MPSYTDQLGRVVHCPEKPQRIISLVPSQSELLFDIGLDAEVAGITKFCVHPESWYYSKRRVGGTKKIDLSAIKKIEPDLIIANKEENQQEDIEALSRQFPVWVSDVKNLDEALSMIVQVGMITGKLENSQTMAEQIRAGFNSLSHRFIPAMKPIPAIYLIWHKPFMLAGSDTFIHDMMNKCRLINAQSVWERYPQISLEDIAASGAEYILLSSEPFPFNQQHAAELKKQMPGAHIILVDGEMFSWYGSRLLRAPAYFESLCVQMLQ